MKLILLNLMYGIIALHCQPLAKSTHAPSDFLRWFVAQASEPAISQKTAQLDISKLQALPGGQSFTKQDSASIQRQIEVNNRTLFDRNDFAGKKILTEAELNQPKTRGAVIFLRVSRPIIVSDKIWIYVERFCGDNCGSGQIEVYGIHGSVYERLFTKTIWIS